MATLYYAGQFATTQLSVGGGIDASQTTGIVINTIPSGVDYTKAGVMCLTWANPLDTTTSEWITYTSINNSTKELQGVTRGAEGSTGKAHLNGASVAFVVSKSHINNLITNFLAEHTEAGLHNTFRPPEGFLINGKIVPSVASNNLTVALKGMDGNDPSASNPIYVRIGDTVRSITSALSITGTVAGYNTFNMGSAELATKEVDLFVYLGVHASDGSVFLAVARLPYFTLISDGNRADGTNENYIYVSTGASPADTDTIVNIGRFAAILSAGAGYTWSVPTFTSANLIQKPIYETRWLSWLPTYAGFTGAVTTSTAKYRVNTRVMFLEYSFSGTSNANTMTFTVPFTIATRVDALARVGDNNAAQADAGLVVFTAGGRTVSCYKTLTAGTWTTSNTKQIENASSVIEI